MKWRLVIYLIKILKISNKDELRRRMYEQNENLKRDKKHKKTPNRCHRIEVYNKFFKKKIEGLNNSIYETEGSVNLKIWEWNLYNQNKGKKRNEGKIA